MDEGIVRDIKPPLRLPEIDFYLPRGLIPNIPVLGFLVSQLGPAVH